MEDQDLFQEVFEHPERFPSELVNLVNQMAEETQDYNDMPYSSWLEYNKRLNAIGYECEYGMDGSVYGLKELITTK